MEAIGATGRQALMEMRRMLGVLRENDGVATLAPQPGVEQLTELVEQIRTAGLPVEFEVGGRPVSLPTGQELAIYRIVQEALTNVMKHAGPAASAHMSHCTTVIGRSRSGSVTTGEARPSPTGAGTVWWACASAPPSTAGT